MVTATTCLTPTHSTDHAPAPAAPEEKVVVQYSPEWVALMYGGADIRNGNIVDCSTVRFGPMLGHWIEEVA